jgi:hypothetical protein
VRDQVAAYRAAGVQRFFLQQVDHRDLDAIGLLAETLVR